MPASGLVGWWKLLDGTGTTAADSSGNANNGTLAGSPTWITTGPNGGGLSFRGGNTQDSVRIPRATVLEPSAFTISVWIKGPLDQNFRQGVFGKAFNNDNTTPYQSYHLAVQGTIDPTAAIFSVGILTDAFEINIAGVLNSGEWQNLVGTYDPTVPAPRQLFYLNGSLIGNNVSGGPVNYDTTSAGDLYIATNSIASASPKFYAGAITDCQIYNRALNADEVATIYNGQIATPTISPNGGNFYNSVAVSLSDDESGIPGFAMYYTLDGSVPTTLSTPYTGSFTITTNCTVRVLAIATNFLNNDLATASFNLTSGSGGHPIGTLEVIPNTVTQENVRRHVVYRGTLQANASNAIYPVGGIPLKAVFNAAFTPNGQLDYVKAWSRSGSGYIYSYVLSADKLMILQAPPSGSLVTATPLQQLSSVEDSMSGVFADRIIFEAGYLRNI